MLSIVNLLELWCHRCSQRELRSSIFFFFRFYLTHLIYIGQPSNDFIQNHFPVFFILLGFTCVFLVSSHFGSSWSLVLTRS